ncbi:MAG: ribbon-helix-helix protein, CopG family [Nostoc desertorum CM1-VF14]|jgi:predicted DNA-binding protein|nr:ribbon-helix-helix protein, CopG family [Nostoc desertorum CM1-VF14]
MNKEWVAKVLIIDLPSSEAENLEKHCSKSGKTQSDVIRELIRSLPVSFKNTSHK